MKLREKKNECEDNMEQNSKTVLDFGFFLRDQR